MREHSNIALEAVDLLARHIGSDGRNAAGGCLTASAGRGWSARLQSYRWRSSGYEETEAALDGIRHMGSGLAAAADAGDVTSPASIELAEGYAERVFAWGGKRPKIWSPADVLAVVAWATGHGSEPAVGFGASWSKVAALCTSHLETSPAGQPHAIADSRVTACLALRLDLVLQELGVRDTHTVFPGLALMPGEGGRHDSAREQLRLWWPVFRRQWRTQTTVSRIVLLLRDALNAWLGLPGMPLPGGGTGAWTCRGVEMVLFMDGD